MTKSRTVKARRAAITGAVLAPLLFVIGALSAGATSHTATRLGTADNFAILAGSTITNTGHSVISGDVGLHPGTAVTGFEDCVGAADCATHTGAMHITDDAAAQAKADLLTAYNTLIGIEGCTSVNVELGGGNTLTPGVYCSPTFGLTGDLTLDGAGEYIFLTGAGGTTLITAAGSRVLLTNGADACNVYWQVGESATIGANSTFAGNILAEASISFGSGATLLGSALALDAAVTLIANTITDTTCAADAIDETPPPVDETPPPIDETPPPVDETPPPIDETPPPVDETPPPIDETPPPIDETPPPIDDVTNPDDDLANPDDDAADDAANDAADAAAEAEAARVLSLQAANARALEAGLNGQLAMTGTPVQIHFYFALFALFLGIGMVHMSRRPIPAPAHASPTPPAGRANGSGGGGTTTVRRAVEHDRRNERAMARPSTLLFVLAGAALVALAATRTRNDRR